MSARKPRPLPAILPVEERALTLKEAARFLSTRTDIVKLAIENDRLKVPVYEDHLGQQMLLRSDLENWLYDLGMLGM